MGQSRPLHPSSTTYLTWLRFTGTVKIIRVGRLCKMGQMDFMEDCLGTNCESSCTPAGVALGSNLRQSSEVIMMSYCVDGRCVFEERISLLINSKRDNGDRSCTVYGFVPNRTDSTDLDRVS